MSAQQLANVGRWSVRVIKRVPVIGRLTEPKMQQHASLGCYGGNTQGSESCKHFFMISICPFSIANYGLSRLPRRTACYSGFSPFKQEPNPQNGLLDTECRTVTTIGWRDEKQSELGHQRRLVALRCPIKEVAMQHLLASCSNLIFTFPENIRHPVSSHVARSGHHHFYRA